MKKTFTLFALLLSALATNAATYRNYVGHFIFGTTYTIFVNSDTAFGEDAIGQICYTPSGGGATQYTGFVVGSYDDTTVPGANWKVVITIPAGATSPLLELANENQSNQQYGWTGCNIALSNVLPVELTHFDAQKSGSSVMLNWGTASEKNNDKFVVERSADGEQFQAIGNVQGAGTTLMPQQYRFQDNTPHTGMNYYRLMSVETDGKTTYSHLVSVGFSARTSNLLTFPNPANAVLNIAFTSEKDMPVMLEVFDFLGKKCLLQSGDAVKGNNQFTVDITTLPIGIYVVRVNDESLRFMKLK